MYENNIIKPTKTFLQEWGGGKELIKSNRGDEFDQSTFYIYIGISQCNTFVQFTLAKN
jgi:predicted nuclease of restriction endonuclease-like (RecB) superfamily